MITAPNTFQLIEFSRDAPHNTIYSHIHNSVPYAVIREVWMSADFSLWDSFEDSIESFHHSLKEYAQT